MISPIKFNLFVAKIYELSEPRSTQIGLGFFYSVHELFENRKVAEWTVQTSRILNSIDLL